MTYGIPQPLNCSERLIELMPYLWENKPNAKGLIQSVGGILQEIEDLFQSLLTDQNIYSAVGAQLDKLGALLKTPRDGLLDEEYRSALLAKISTIGASGTITDVKNSSKQITGSSICNLYEHDLLCMYIFVDNPVTLNEANSIEITAIAGARTRVMFAPTEKYVRTSVDSEQIARLAECGEDLFECGAEASEVGGTLNLDETSSSASVYMGFTSLVEGATSYETIDDRGVLCSLSSVATESVNTGYLVDDSDNYILNQVGTNIRYIK